MKEYIQNMGRSLMLPVATLPAAAIFVGIANWVSSYTKGDVVSSFLFFAGLAVLANLGLLFAVGLAYGMSRDHDGAAALAGLVGFLTPLSILNPEAVAKLKGFDKVEAFKEAMPDVALAFDKINNGNVFIGIIAGLLAAAIYNRFHTVKLPAALSFFSGKRLVPILAVAFMAAVSLVLLFIWPVVFEGLIMFGKSIMGLGPIGAGIYGFFNRLLIPAGLHHALNNVFWFGIAGIDDIGRFWTPSAEYKGAAVEIAGYYPGMYQAGFFPIMMFGLPAGAFAIYRNARPERRKAVGSIMLAAAVASFFTGVTEPLEFSFMFAAFPLYVIHAVLTGIVLAFTAAMGWASGFNFSAGFVDFVLAFPSEHAVKPYMLLVEGVVVAVLYYFVFSFAIKTFNLKTPGREDNVVAVSDAAAGDSAEDPYMAKAKAIYAGLGGDKNVAAIDYCTTRLRAVVEDMDAVDQGAILATGVPAVNPVGDKNIQVIVGTDVQFIHDNIQELRKGLASDAAAVKPIEPLHAVAEGTFKPLSEVADQAFASGTLGEGFAIVPSSNQVYSPVDAEVVNVFPAKHAVILRSGDGVEMLVHMGIDTVELKGEPFEVEVKKGDQVAAGAALATMDIEAVKAAGKETDILVVFPQKNQVESLELTASGTVAAGQQVGSLVAAVKVS